MQSGTAISLNPHVSNTLCRVSRRPSAAKAAACCSERSLQRTKWTLQQGIGAHCHPTGSFFFQNGRALSLSRCTMSAV
jgi:hypothetical protein